MATKPMDAYSQLLCRPEWARKRMVILERDGFRCVACRTMGEPDNRLQVDHKIYARGGFPWDVPDNYLQTVCRRCHERFTALRRRLQEIAADMNLYELPIAVQMLEGFWGDQRPHTVPPTAIARTTITLRRLELIQQYEAEKNGLLELEFTGTRSSRVEELDEMIDVAWKQIQEAA